jgi:hypothetical protein
MTYRLAHKPHCPVCQAPLDGATSVDSPDAPIAPSPGDVSICVYCRAWLCYDATRQWQKLNQAEFAALPARLREQLLFLATLPLKPAAQ